MLRLHAHVPTRAGPRDHLLVRRVRVRVRVRVGVEVRVRVRVRVRVGLGVGVRVGVNCYPARDARRIRG